MLKCRFWALKKCKNDENCQKTSKLAEKTGKIWILYTPKTSINGKNSIKWWKNRRKISRMNEKMLKIWCQKLWKIEEKCWKTSIIDEF